MRRASKYGWWHVGPSTLLRAKVCCCMLCVVRQTCIAPDYILVHESVKAEFTKKLLEFIPKNFGA